MAGERTLPGLGLYGYWTLGSNGYRPQHSGNLRTLSTLVQPRAASRTTALPSRAEGNDGAVYIVPSTDPTNPNKVAIADFDTDDTTRIWVYLSVAEGYMFYVVDEDAYLKFDGSAWVDLVPTIPDAINTVVEQKTASYAPVPADFTGKKILNMNSGSGLALTINSGLSVTEPIYAYQGGAGVVTVTAGASVTLVPADLMATANQYDFFSITPIGTNTYLVKGEVAAP